MINHAIITLLIAMAAMDLPVIGGRLWIRVLIQGLCLFIGLFWWAGHLSMPRVKAYWPLAIYLMTLLAGAIFSSDPLFVMLQIGSLLGVLLLSTAFAEQKVPTRKDVERAAIHALGTILVLIMCASFVLMIIGSPSAYQYSTGEYRFQGVYAEPASFSASAGLAIGYALFGIRRVLLKIIIVAICAICLYQSGSRTFAGAIVVAGLLTGWIVYRHHRMRILKIGVPLGLIAIIVVSTANLKTEELVESYARSDSISTMTGRTVLWSAALSRLPERLLLGYGFTLGTSSISGEVSRPPAATGSLSQLQQPASRAKLHSGYVQALLDSGIFGALAYFAIFAVAAWRLIKHERTASYPFFCFVFFFCATANFTETMIHSASVFRSVIGWTSIALALSLARTPTMVGKSAIPRGPEK